MTAEEILNIEKCGDLFPNNIDESKKVYRDLAHKWHPDLCKDPSASEVFSKINELYRMAEKMILNGTWEKSNYITIPCKNNKKIGISYDVCYSFELGKYYVTKTNVIYVFDYDKSKYYFNALKNINSIKYENEQLKNNFQESMPEKNSNFEANDGRYILILNKPEGIYPLRAVLEYFDNKIYDKHVAWIISRLSNIACFLEYNNLVHNGICVDNCFISPENHTIHLYGGWWYTTAIGEKMLGTTSGIYSVMSASAKGKKTSSVVTDLESIKLIGRELLGDNSGKVLKSLSIPEGFIKFVTEGSGKSAFQEFEKWDKLLTMSYGKRVFVPMEIENLYKK